MVPKLRFPEFREAGEWEEKALEKISPSIFDGTHQTPKYTVEGIPFFSVENIVSGNKNKFISRQDYLEATRKNKPEKGDILITRIGNIGFSAIVVWDFEFSIYVTLAAIKKSDKFNSYYLHCYFQSEQYQSEIRSKSLLNAVPCKINMDELRKTKVLLPSPKEQQKIATCLSSLDYLIKAQSEKIKTLQSHKKGLMQQLFPAEGETVPRVRFGEFLGKDEWAEKTLGDKNVALFEKEKTPLEKLNILSYVSTENLLPDYAGVTTASKLPQSGSFTKYKAGDILISNIRPYLKKVWAADKEGAASNDVIVIRASSAISKSFLSFLLKNDSFINFVMEGAKGLKMPRGDKSLMEEYRIMFPNKGEQRKIADCLISLDDLITAQSQKLEALKAHKKGLMQQIFPNPNET